MAGVDVGDDYLEVALSLGKLVPGWVEGYVGPAERAEAVDRGDPATPGQLRDRVEALRTKVEDEEEAPDRRGWLLAQLQGISSALLSLSGAQLEYAELFALCHGAHVEHVPVRQFEEAHGLLDRALPGGGEVSARYQAWRKTQL